MIDLVSVIMPSYNSEFFLKESIESVVNQTHSNWEMIIVDDCSKDKSVDIVKEFIKKDSRIQLIVNSVNEGAAVSRNKAIKQAKGDYVAFLDSDDLWLETKLSDQLDFMVNNNYSFTYTYYDQIDELNLFLKSVNKMPIKVNYLDTIKHNKIGCLTVIFKKDAFNDYFMPQIRKRQDFGLWLKLLKQSEYAYCLPKTLSKYRIRENSISRNKLSLIKFHWELYRNIENHSIAKSMYYISYLIFSKLYEKFQ